MQTYYNIRGWFSTIVNFLFWVSIAYAATARSFYLLSNRKKLNELNPVNDRTSYLAGYVFHLAILTLCVSLYLGTENNINSYYESADTIVYEGSLFADSISKLPGVLFTCEAYRAIIWMCFTVGARLLRYRAIGLVVGALGAALVALDLCA